MLYLPGILTSLAYLMGERGVNSSTTGPRTNFVQSALEEAYHAYPWKFAQRNTTLAISNGICTLPTDYDYAMPRSACWYPATTSQRDMTEIDVVDKGLYEDGDDKFWITVPAEGTFVFNTKDTQATSVSFTYQALPPVLDTQGIVGTAYPNKRTLAIGARRDVKLGQNPDADISQEQNQFEKALANDIATAQVPAPRKKRKTPTYHTGDF